METIKVKEVTRLLADNAHILDLGCGEGRHTHAAQWHLGQNPDVTIVGLDLSLANLKLAREKGEDFFNAGVTPASYTQASAYRLPFADEQFDLVIFSEVLEHLHQDNLALSEAVRILKPGGQLCLSVPRFWPERVCWAFSDAYHHVDGGHLRIYTRKALETMLSSHPLTCTTHYYAHGLHSIYWWLRCVFWRFGEDVWPCRLYHKLLVWDLLKKPALTRTLERALNPIMGKSQVWHLTKQPTKQG